MAVASFTTSNSESTTSVTLVSMPSRTPPTVHSMSTPKGSGSNPASGNRER